jgi:hypothetical protein
VETLDFVNEPLLNPSNSFPSEPKPKNAMVGSTIFDAVWKNSLRV